MSENNTLKRRNFLGEALREAVGAIREAEEIFWKTAESINVFSSSDTSYTLTRHYPRELYEEEAQRLGIDIDEVGIDEAVRLIFAHHGYESGA